MIDAYAPLVVALTHTGFPMARSVPRAVWERLLLREAPFEELLQLVKEAPEAEEAVSALNEVELELERLAERGVWCRTWFHSDYPPRLRAYLGRKSPPVLFGIGATSLLATPAIAVVGSRQAGPAALAFAEALAHEAIRRGKGVVSGGAKGVDLAALASSGKSGGGAIAFAADALSVVHRKLLAAGCPADRTTVLTPNHPESGFTVGQAMGRNKLIYGFAEAAAVVACEEGSGGTWTGAVEALKMGAIPVGVWVGAGSPGGNRALVGAGAKAIRSPEDLFGLAVPRAVQGAFEL